MAFLSWKKHFEIDSPIHGDGGCKKGKEKRMFGRFLALRGPLRPPEGPQWLPLDNLEWSEKSRENMIQWDDFIIAFWAAAPIGDKVL